MLMLMIDMVELVDLAESHSVWDVDIEDGSDGAEPIDLLCDLETSVEKSR